MTMANVRALSVAMGAVVVLGHVPACRAQTYAFKDEPLMSINRSYLGYSNFVWQGPHAPAPGYVTQYGQARSPGYVRAAAPAPAVVAAPAPVQRRGRWFWRRRGYAY